LDFHADSRRALGQPRRVVGASTDSCDEGIDLRSAVLERLDESNSRQYGLTMLAMATTLTAAGRRADGGVRAGLQIASPADRGDRGGEAQVSGVAGGTAGGGSVDVS